MFSEIGGENAEAIQGCNFPSYELVAQMTILRDMLNLREMMG